MHIYRLAIELGILGAKYMDNLDRFALSATLSSHETQRLQRLDRDPNQWGCWALDVHTSGVQRGRQYRAYRVYHEEHGEPRTTGGIYCDFGATLDHCHCEDFLNRKLPCMHIYALALVSKLSVPFADFEAARNQRAYSG